MHCATTATNAAADAGTFRRSTGMAMAARTMVYTTIIGNCSTMAAAVVVVVDVMMQDMLLLILVMATQDVAVYCGYYCGCTICRCHRRRRQSSSGFGVGDGRCCWYLLLPTCRNHTVVAIAFVTCFTCCRLVTATAYGGTIVSDHKVRR